MACARIDLDAGQAQELARLLAGSADWEKVLVRATRHGIATLLCRHLHGRDVPGSVDRALEMATRAARLLVLRQRHETARLLDALAEVVRFYGARLDWDGVAARATGWGAAEYVYLALRTAEELLGCLDAGGALLSLRPEGFDEWLVAAACQRVLSLAPPGAPVPVSDNLGRLLRPASPGENLHWLERSMFPSRARLAFLYHLAPGSWRVWVYYLFRPFHLLRRYARVVAGVAARRPGAVAAAQAKAEQLRLEEWFEGQV